MPINNLKSANKLSTNILNYFAAFTETRFNFRTLINYRWTNNELTLDLAIFQDFQDKLLAKIKTGDRTPLSVRGNEHILTLSGGEILPEIDKVLDETKRTIFLSKTRQSLNLRRLPLFEAEQV